MAVRTAMGSVDLTVSQTLRSVTWPNVAVVSIRPHLRALIERETNEPDESRQTDKMQGANRAYPSLLNRCKV